MSLRCSLFAPNAEVLLQRAVRNAEKDRLTIGFVRNGHPGRCHKNVVLPQSECSFANIGPPTPLHHRWHEWIGSFFFMYSSSAGARVWSEQDCQKTNFNAN